MFTRRMGLALALVLTLVIGGVALAQTEGTPISDQGIVPLFYDTGPGGNVECSEVGDYEFSSDRFDDGNQYSGTAGPITWETTDNTYVSWSGTHGGLAIILKGGPAANVYIYDASYTYDSGLASPPVGEQQDPAELSNITFCWDPGEEELTVTKTAVTYFEREHFWDIDKNVETDEGYELDDVAKIWLYIDGSGNETATWTVDVTYEGYEDSDWNVSGEITIENTGTLDAVITGIDDFLGGEEIDVDCGEDFEFDYTLEVGDTLTCSYSEDVDSKIAGKNEVTVTTERDEYFADAEIIWGDPDEEYDASVTITDTNPGFADEYGQVVLNADDYEAGDVETFTYTKDFAWADYGADDCGSFTYDNTATIVETEQSASATLKVNVQCFIYETAYAKGDDAVCFIPYFNNWGWTNPIEPGEYTWDLWAGAAQCDTDKGTLVGSVTVVYNDDGYVTVEYDMDAAYVLDETHVYAGYDMFPQVQRGPRTVDTVAPGQYYNDSPFDGSQVYVIAHAVVGMPDPDFGP